jgi:integrase
LREKRRGDWNANWLVVPSVLTGNLQTPSTFSKYLKRAIEAAGFPDVTLHVLRHAHISLLGSLGVHPRTMQAQAWHSSSSFTLDKYQHLMSGAQTEAAALLDAAMREAGFHGTSP